SFANLDKKIENVVTNVAGDSLVKQDDTGLITIGGKVSGTKVSIANIDNAVRILTGVNAGSITATSTDAINGSQLYSMSNVVAGYFSRDAGYDADGKWNAPTFTVKVFDKNGSETETHYANVADAFTGVNTSFVNLDKKIENVATNVAGNSLVKQEEATGLITIGRKVGGTRVSIVNSDNAARTLSGVNAGSITATSTEAVNGSQFYAMSNEVASYFSRDAGYDKDGNWNAPTFTVKVFDKDGSGAEEEYKNVADAFTGVNTSFVNLDKKIENVATNVAGNSLVKQEEATGLITIGGEVNGTRVSIANRANAPRVLSGVNAGSITAISTDAINGSQFYSMSNEVASYFSRDAGYDADGHWNAPTFTVKVVTENGSETEMYYYNVADALSGVSSSFTNLNQKIKNVTDGGLVKQNSTGLITIGASRGGDRINIANDMGTPRVLSGVKGGAFTKTSTEAVNGSQLYLLSQAFASYFGGGAGYDKDGQWSGPAFTIKAFDQYGNESENTYMSVADAFAGVNNALLGLNQRVKDGIGVRNDNNIITEGFPFMRMVPRALGKRKNGDMISISSGKISANSTDAINGAQLQKTNGNVRGVEDQVTEVEKRVTEVEKKVDVAVSYDVDKNGKKTNSITLAGGNESEPVLINNVKDGEIKADSKQAVNGSQLYNYTNEQTKIVLDESKKYTDQRVNNIVVDAIDDAVVKSKQYTDMKFEALNYNIENVRKEARQAAAIGLAVSNLRYFDDPGSLSVSFGSGLWRGQSAFAIGAGYTSEDGKIRSNLSATSAGGHWGVGGGITLKLK
ncbi:YadA-like family protein, partial [Bartonella elizabethae]